MSTLKVDGIRSNSATSDAITLASNGTCTANITNNLSNRNLIINGAMNVVQRGSTSTSQGFQTVDRFAAWYGGTDEAPTQSTFDVSPPSSPYHLPTSGAHPYKEGFRKAFGVTNGNQTSGAGAGDYVMLRYKVEAQDIANSGWDYTSASSYITLSFWVKSSVAQNFYCRLETADGTNQNYPFETGSLSAFTWTKITKTIPGNANLTFNNDNGNGLELHWQMFRGTDFTDNSVSNDTWAVYASGTRTKDATSTWYTTNNASFQITGVQLEVDHTGSGVATDFEHRSFGQELALCQRYFQRYATGDGKVIGQGFYYESSHMKVICDFPTTMRATPTLSMITGTHYYVIYRDGAADTFNSFTIDGGADTNRASIYSASDISGTAGQAGVVKCNNAAPNGGQIDFIAEL